MARQTASKLFVQIVQRDVDTNPGVEDELHPEPLDELDFAAQHRFGQAILRQREAQHAARLRQGIEYGHVMSQQGEVERSGQARWPGAGYRDLASRRLQLARDQALHGLLESGRSAELHRR